MKRYYLKNGQIALGDCSVNYTEYSCNTLEHEHEAIELVYVISGSGEHVVNDTSVMAKRGSLLIMNHNCTHEIRMLETMKYYNIMFKASFIDNSLNENDDLKTLLNKRFSFEFSDDFLAVDFEDEESIQRVDRLFYDILGESIKKENRCIDMVRCYIDGIIHLMLRRVGTSASNEDDLFFKNVTKYVIKNSGEKLSLADAAKEFRYDPDYFSKKLKRSGGMTFTQLVLRKKLSDAIYNLLRTDDSVDEIIHRCGFTNKTYFYSAFERYYGIKPKFVREYRKNYQKYLELWVEHREQL